MMQEHTEYTVLTPQVHKVQWVEEQQKAVPGWAINVRDAKTGTVVPVFVPDIYYTADNVREYIERALVAVREVHNLSN